jgi:lipoyl(octanoyl) transferase
MSLIIRSLGRQDYMAVLRAMQRFTDWRSDTTPDEIWLLEHHPVYTQGMAGKPEHILNPGTIPVVPIDRGGQVTYHGHGQLIVYFLLDVQRRQLAPRQLVRLIEQLAVDLLAHWQITATTRVDAPGLYVDGAKIASIGLRIRRGACYHGLAVNVTMDLLPFLGINPCGQAGMKMLQMSDFQTEISFISVERYVQQLCRGYFDAR